VLGICIYIHEELLLQDKTINPVGSIQQQEGCHNKQDPSSFPSISGVDELLKDMDIEGRASTRVSVKHIHYLLITVGGSAWALSGLSPVYMHSNACHYIYLSKKHIHSVPAKRDHWHPLLHSFLLRHSLPFPVILTASSRVLHLLQFGMSNYRMLCHATKCCSICRL
jgi:hypothetical protein